jgi:hypothetical protein
MKKLLKKVSVTTPILVFPDWEKVIALGEVLTQPGEGDIDHPISFSRRKLSDSEHNYNTT